MKTLEERRAYHRAWYAKNRQRVVDGVRQWRRKNPGAKAAQHRRDRYRLSRDEYSAMLKAQKGLCAICERVPSGRGKVGVLHVDHDHESGQNRALLCHRCNAALGGFHDSPELLEKAAAYVRNHREVLGETAA